MGAESKHDATSQLELALVSVLLYKWLAYFHMIDEYLSISILSLEANGWHEV